MARSAALIMTLAVLVLVVGHVRFDHPELGRAGRVQYVLHLLYAVLEPAILRLLDFFLARPRLLASLPGRALFGAITAAGHWFPHGIVLSTASAGRLVDYLEGAPGGEGPRIAVGPCVCQRALDRWREPRCKDIVVLYGADIYRYLDLGYRVITGAEAKALLGDCAAAGLVHALDFCRQSGAWVFVLCNCDADICVLVRTYGVTGKFIYPGPELVTHDPARCRGARACGRCIPACLFRANGEREGFVTVDQGRCMGCGQCVARCPAAARHLVGRASGYRDDVLPAHLLR